LAQAQPSTAPRLFEPGSSLFLPPEASTAAAQTDAVFSFIYWVSAFFVVLITVLTLVFVIRFRRRTPGAGPVSNIRGSTKLEITWTVIPLVLVVTMFWLGFVAYVDQSVAPGNAVPIIVHAQKWAWSFEYANGYRDPELHLEVGTPYALTLTSNDVIHSLFIPAFRLKKDAVPGRYNKVWFTPTRVGTYPLYCAEYCGTRHSDMIARVVVHPRGEWTVWLNRAGDVSGLPLFERGARIYARATCISCHSTDGTLIGGGGPTFKDIWGHEAHVTVGGQTQTVTVNEDYVRESILYPMAKIVVGFPAVMPSFKGQLSDDEILALIEFIKSRAAGYVPPPTSTSAPGATSGPASAPASAPAAADTPT
jgi:cytochrome c oxidase subunit 2